MFNRYYHAYQINQEKVQKSLFKSLFIVMNCQTPYPFNPPYLSSAYEFWKYFASWFLPLDSPFALILHASHQKLKKQRSGNQKNRRIRPKPSMILCIILLQLFDFDSSFSKVPTVNLKYGKTPNVSSRQQFYSFFSKSNWEAADSRLSIATAIKNLTQKHFRSVSITQHHDPPSYAVTLYMYWYMCVH